MNIKLTPSTVEWLRQHLRNLPQTPQVVTALQEVEANVGRPDHVKCPFSNSGQNIWGGVNCPIILHSEQEIIQHLVTKHHYILEKDLDDDDDDVVAEYEASSIWNNR